MVTKTFCDKCGDEIVTEVIGQVDTYLIHIGTGAVAADVSEKDQGNMDITQKFHLCLKCHGAVQDFLKKKMPSIPEKKSNERRSSIT